MSSCLTRCKKSTGSSITNKIWYSSVIACVTSVLRLSSSSVDACVVLAKSILSFTNKVVIVTGASAGIGASTAVLFAKEGANLALVGRNQDKLKNVAEQCSQNGSPPLIIAADLSKDKDVERIIKETIDKYGKLDVLVNNAGISMVGNITNGKIVDAYDEIMHTNVRAVIHLTTLATPHLVKTKGNIVNISSVAGKKIRTPEYMAYNISKAALDHFTRGAALEMSASGVRVNGVSPGPTKTDIFATANLSVNTDIYARIMPLKRVSNPEEIADLILYIASDKAKGITGSDIVCDNGFLIASSLQ